MIYHMGSEHGNCEYIPTLTAVSVVLTLHYYFHVITNNLISTTLFQLLWCSWINYRN